MDEINSDPQKDDTGNDIATEDPTTGGTRGQKANTADSDDGGNHTHNQHSISEWFSRKFTGHRPLEWLTFAFEVLTFFALCIYSYFSFGQWQAMKDQKVVMQGQLNQMQRGATQTDTLIKATVAATFEETFRLAGPSDARIVLHNRGKARAKDIKGIANTTIKTLKDGSVLFNASLDFSESAVQSDGEIQRRVAVGFPGYDALANTTIVILQSEISYNDGFGTVGQSFCFGFVLSKADPTKASYGENINDCDSWRSDPKYRIVLSNLQPVRQLR